MMPTSPWEVLGFYAGLLLLIFGASSFGIFKKKGFLLIPGWAGIGLIVGVLAGNIALGVILAIVLVLVMARR